MNAVKAAQAHAPIPAALADAYHLQLRHRDDAMLIRRQAGSLGVRIGAATLWTHLGPLSDNGPDLSPFIAGFAPATAQRPHPAPSLAGCGRAWRYPNVNAYPEIPGSKIRERRCSATAGRLTRR
jgi:hypothetical protein